jgi:hypothetical protein
MSGQHGDEISRLFLIPVLTTFNHFLIILLLPYQITNDHRSVEFTALPHLLWRLGQPLS